MKDGGYLRYIIPMIWFSLFLIGCKSQKQETAILFDKNPPFMIAEAQFQRWTTANNIHKSGWNLFVTFEEIEPTVTMEEVFFRDHRAELRNNAKLPNRYLAKLTDEKPDFVMHSDPLKEAANTPPTKPAFHLGANEAVITYRFQGTEKYYKITDLKEKNTISYPR